MLRLVLSLWLFCAFLSPPRSECAPRPNDFTATTLHRTFGNEVCVLLRLKGGFGDVGPKAKLIPEDGDVLVHHPSPDMPRPSHRCLRSALHRSRVRKWNGRRIFVSSTYFSKKQDVLQTRYSWDKPIRIGTMQFGSGNSSVVRVAGDDEVQLWGQWHFAGPSAGIFQGLYCMYTIYSPYKPLMLIEKYSSVLFQQV